MKNKQKILMLKQQNAALSNQLAHTNGRLTEQRGRRLDPGPLEGAGRPINVPEPPRSSPVLDRLVAALPVILPALLAGVASLQAEQSGEGNGGGDAHPLQILRGLSVEVGGALRPVLPALTRIGIDHEPADLAELLNRRLQAAQERSADLAMRVIVLTQEAEAKHAEEHKDDPPAVLTAGQVADVDLFIARIETALAQHNDNPAKAKADTYYTAPEILKFGRETFPAEAFPAFIVAAIRTGQAVESSLLELHIPALRSWAEAKIREAQKKPCCDDCAKSGGSCKDKAINRARSAKAHADQEIAMLRHALPRLANRRVRLDLETVARLFDLDRQLFDGV